MSRRAEVMFHMRDLVDARTCRIGAALAEARDRAVDDARIDLLHALIVDTELCLDVGAEVFDHDVGFRGDEG